MKSVNNSKIKHIILFIFLFQLLSLSFLIFPQAVLAYDLEVKIPGNSGAGASIGTYVAAIYKYAVGAVGILATVVMMMAGIMWMMAGGNPERVANAKTWITGAITGLLLAVCSYTILYLVNPDLVNFKNIEPLTIKEMGCCQLEKTCTYLTQEKCAEQKGSYKGKEYSCINNKCELSSKEQQVCMGKKEFDFCKTEKIDKGFCDGYNGKCVKCLDKGEFCNTDLICCSGNCLLQRECGDPKQGLDPTPIP